MEAPPEEEVIGMDEKKTYIDFIVKMLERCDMRKIKLVYAFILGLTN